jgi:hypothetical protein
VFITVLKMPAFHGFSRAVGRVFPAGWTGEAFGVGCAPIAHEIRPKDQD